MRHVNKYLTVAKFRYENSRAVRDIIEENDYFSTFDLKSGYHHIPIAKEHQKYLGFAWDFTVKTRSFVFVVLPFGLATAGYAFSKVMRSFMKKWRAEGKRTSLYLDDGIIVGKDIAVTEITTYFEHTSSLANDKSFKVQANALVTRELFGVSDRHTENDVYRPSRKDFTS